MKSVFLCCCSCNKYSDFFFFFHPFLEIKSQTGLAAYDQIFNIFFLTGIILLPDFWPLISSWVLMWETRVRWQFKRSGRHLKIGNCTEKNDPYTCFDRRKKKRGNLLFYFSLDIKLICHEFALLLGWRLKCQYVFLFFFYEEENKWINELTSYIFFII